MLFELIKSLCTAFLQKIVLATCGGVVFSLFGSNAIAWQVVLILTFIDLITGVMVAYRKKELSSRKCFRSVPKILLYMLLMVAAHQMTRYFNHSGVELFNFAWLEYAIVAYIAANEMLSLIENLHYLGIPVPNKIRNKLKDYLETENT